MAVPKKHVSKMRTRLRNTNWKKEVIPQALKALSLAKSTRTTRGNFRSTSGASAPQTDLKENGSSESDGGGAPGNS